MPFVTIGSGIEFDVYADVPTADEYLAGSYSATAWRDAVEDDKGRGLVTSTRGIDVKLWKGEKTDSAQLHAFPRTGLVYADGSAVPSDVVPDEVINASIELAALILDGTESQNAANVASGTRRLKAGSVEIEYFRSLAGPYGSAAFPKPVLDLIGLWLAGSGAGLDSAIATGTDSCSIADRRYGLTHGF